MKRKHGSDSSSCKSSSEDELAEISSDSHDHGHDHGNEECLDVSEYNPSVKSFDNLNDSEVDKYFTRAKHHV